MDGEKYAHMQQFPLSCCGHFQLCPQITHQPLNWIENHLIQQPITNYKDHHFKTQDPSCDATFIRR